MVLILAARAVSGCRDYGWKALGCETGPWMPEGL